MLVYFGSNSKVQIWGLKKSDCKRNSFYNMNRFRIWNFQLWRPVLFDKSKKFILRKAQVKHLSNIIQGKWANVTKHNIKSSLVAISVVTRSIFTRITFFSIFQTFVIIQISHVYRLFPLFGQVVFNKNMKEWVIVCRVYCFKSKVYFIHLIIYSLLINR